MSRAADLPEICFVIVAHNDFCPLAHGMGEICAPGCKPEPRVVTAAEYIERVRADARERGAGPLQ